MLWKMIEQEKEECCRERITVLNKLVRVGFNGMETSE